MSAGIDPIYCRAPIFTFSIDSTDSVIGATANTALTGAGTLGTDIFTAFTADATNGGFVNRIRFKAAVSAAATTLTVARIFINNGAVNSTITNNVFYDDITLPSVTPSVTSASPVFELPLNIALPAAYRILVTFATATANGWSVVAIGGAY